MTNLELIDQVRKVAEAYAAVGKQMASAASEVALLVYMIEEESDDG